MTLLSNENKTIPSQSCASSACGAEASDIRYARPAYRIGRGASSYVVSVDLPGVAKGGVDITLEDGLLEIVAQRSWKKPENWKAYENSKKVAYSLKLELGDDVDTGSISARLEDGVLTLDLSKKEEKLPRRISID